MADFSHYSKDGQATMVNIAEKSVSSRYARARGFVRMSPETIARINSNLLPKGDPFDIARIAAIMGAKKTSELIPLCHQLNLSKVDCALEISIEKGGVIVESEIFVDGKTGAEMEALTAVAVGCLTVYDMCKAVDKDMIIEDVCLVEKRGGKSDYTKKT